MALEQAGTGAIGAGVEFDAEQADGIETDADQTFGEAGFVAQQETLGPFLLFGLRGVVLAIVTVEVEVAQLEAGLAVLDKVSSGGGREADDAAGQQQSGSESAGVTVHGEAPLFLLWKDRSRGPRQTGEGLSIKNADAEKRGAWRRVRFNR